MFGISSFAQTSFASLAGNAYSLSINENFNPLDSSSQIFAFLAAITEPVTSNNTDSEVDVFYEGIVEGYSPADSSTQSSAFYLSLIHI